MIVNNDYDHSGDIISLLKHDPNWRLRYEAERVMLLKLFGKRVRAIEHVGSTAIPSIEAKPVVDIMMGVERIDEFTADQPRLRKAGYTWGHGDSLEPDWRFYIKWKRGERLVHLHVVRFKGDFWDWTVRFRDYLRGHAEEARKYETLKRQLVDKFRNDRTRYVAAKSAFIDDILKVASRGEDGASTSSA
ncbi:MAG: GrpB family protein [Candidatus Eremiobacteraeota bacterium]|nr:GrpB family protein [Candidatus Eremiobacteraeota bacterium]